MYAQIIVDVNSRDVDKLFTYAVPEEMELCAGMRVTAPFGPRTLTGMVVSVSVIPMWRSKRSAPCSAASTMNPSSSRR